MNKSDIVKRLKDVNDENLIMDVVRDCLMAAEEIETLRKTCELQKTELKKIKKAIQSSNIKIPSELNVAKK